MRFPGSEPQRAGSGAQGAVVARDRARSRRHLRALYGKRHFCQNLLLSVHVKPQLVVFLRRRAVDPKANQSTPVHPTAGLLLQKMTAAVGSAKGHRFICAATVGRGVCLLPLLHNTAPRHVYSRSIWFYDLLEEFSCPIGTTAVLLIDG